VESCEIAVDTQRMPPERLETTASPAHGPGEVYPRPTAPAAVTAPSVEDRRWPPGAISMDYVEDFFGEATARKLLAETDLREPAIGLEPYVSRRDFWQLCLKNINTVDDEGHGCTPRKLPKSTWQMIFSGVNQMDDVGDGLRHFCDLVQAARTGVVVTVGYGRNGVHLNYTAAQDVSDPVRFERYLELIALVFHCVLLWLTDRQIIPVQIRLSSLLDEADGSLLSGLCAATLRQGQGFTVVYDRDDMKSPLGVRKYQRWSNETNAFEELCAVLATSEDERPASAIVDKVRQLVATEVMTLQELAPAIGMSTATLQRRLREAGTSFREIVRDLRREKLIALLATDIDFDQVAEELGLSERRSLWRACQECLGVSPSEYRRARRGALRDAAA
jgi:AraC-like DNA-binding protein